MDYIVSPYIIYAIAFFYNLDNFLVGVIFLAITAITFWAVKSGKKDKEIEWQELCLNPEHNLAEAEKIYHTDKLEGLKREKERYNKYIVYLIVAIIASMVIKVFIPTQSQMYCMLAASVATKENLTSVKGETLSLVKEIMAEVKKDSGAETEEEWRIE